MGFEGLEGYKPEKVKDGREIIKAKGLKCGVNSARIEQYEGDKLEFKEHEFFRYELEILDNVEHGGRRLWKSFDLNDETKDKRGKTKLNKLADVFWTVDLEFRNKKELEAATEKFVEMTLLVNARGWTPDGEDEERQVHIIKGLSKEGAVESKTPF